jgi:protein O-GlcNAc transferase
MLVDLAMHTDSMRLLAFARKPAPVQLTYLAYAGTTGLDAMDYRLTDSFIDPPNQDELFCSEKSIRVPSYWCYEPSPQAPLVGPAPVRNSGLVTFGCFNHASKISSASLEMWRELLGRVPRSRLILHSPRGSHRERIAGLFTEVGISSDRIEFIDRVPLVGYFQQYQRIDIALDPFPYGGGATTCDALWMGVPLVSLSGQTAVSRAGCSILSSVMLAELIAHGPDDYVTIATELAHDQQRLAELRASLRDRMRQSVLCDAPRFARSIEAAFRTMWQDWCRGAK